MILSYLVRNGLTFVETSDRAGVVPPCFQAKDNLAAKSPFPLNDPGPDRADKGESGQSSSGQARRGSARGVAMATMAAVAGQQMGRMAERGGTRARKETLSERNLNLFEAQKKARRGPTPEVFFAKHIDNSRIVKADDPERRREMRHFAAAMGVLFLLVMVYVWQHFSAIEVGYKIESQKTQVEQLREENRQLRLTEAQLSDPQRIDQMAKQLGLDAPQPGQVVRPDGSVNGPGMPVLAMVR